MYGAGRIRLAAGLVGLMLVASAGAATGSTPRRVMTAPVRFFFPSFDSGEEVAPATTTTTEPACVPKATLRERAARVLIMGMPDVKDASHPLPVELMQLGVGGVLITGGNVDTRAQITKLTGDLKRAARNGLVVSTDEEPGRVTSFGHIIGLTSSARRLAATGTTEAMRNLAREQATDLAAMGITLDLAPVADLDAGPATGTIGDRSFSGDPAVAARYAYAYALGLNDKGVDPVIKHFPGRARAEGDDHLGRIVSNETMAELRENDLKPFADLVAKGAPVVMMSNVDYTAIEPNTPASLSAKAYSMLREMGFKGVAITDSIGMGAVNQRWDWSEAAVKAIASGADGVLSTDGKFARDMVHGLVVAVQTGELSEARLNQAAARMIALAGGDPMAFACQAVELPKLQPQP
ncbi:MAG TPA: glycoside hydrolase family 3 N-terminal domain-containing protein [Acidimicrobiales bacterium]|nr:glycoside hydrolase family 3 N-terminal domain-containing protein [Acidimicrobiales bacterium]